MISENLDLLKKNDFLLQKKYSKIFKSTSPEEKLKIKSCKT